MTNYYLTDMNLLQLENTLMQFLLHNQVDHTLTTGIMTKIATMMYNKQIDYYYADAVATILEVPIKHIDNIYLNGYNKYYNKPLHELLATTNAPATIVEDSQQLEENVQQILQTRRPIKTKKPRRH